MASLQKAIKQSQQLRTRLPPDGKWSIGQANPPRLTVDDIVKLAAAGIKMELAEVMHHLASPEPTAPPEREPGWFNQNRLLQPLIERWRNGMRTNDANDYQMDRELEGIGFPFHLSAWCANELVYLFVGGPGLTPCIIEDEQYMFPSDALMVKLRLLDKQRKPPQQAPTNSTQTVGRMVPVQSKVRAP